MDLNLTFYCVDFAYLFLQDWQSVRGVARRHPTSAGKRFSKKMDKYSIWY